MNYINYITKCPRHNQEDCKFFCKKYTQVLCDICFKEQDDCQVIFLKSGVFALKSYLDLYHIEAGRKAGILKKSIDGLTRDLEISNLKK